MKLSSVLNKFRKNGLQFEQVGDTPFYNCKHELVENTYVQVLVQADGVTVSNMAIVQQYDEQSNTKTWFSTINGLLESFLMDVKRAEEKAAAEAAAQEKMAAIEEVAAEEKTADQSYNEGFLVVRTRQSVTQGYATVYYYGIEIATYGDEMDIIKDGEQYHGELLGGWASRISDESFIEAAIRRPSPNLFALAATQAEIEPVEIADGFSIERQGDQVSVYFRNRFLMTAANDSSRQDNEYFAVAQKFFSDKVSSIDLERQAPEIAETVELQPASSTIDIDKFELKRDCNELHVFYNGVYITTYEISGEVTVSYYIHLTISIYRNMLENINESRPTTVH